MDGKKEMARNHDTINFRTMADHFLLVNDIDVKTKMIIKQSGFRIRQDDNAMLVYGYIDHEAGLSYELLCAACVFNDDDVSLEPTNRTTSFKFRYGSFQGDLVPFKNESQLYPYLERAQMIKDGYKVSEEILAIRAIQELDSSRAPGYPDDVVLMFFKEGYRNEGIWCRTEGANTESHLVQMKMLNEPMGPFGKHMEDIIDVALIRMDNGEVKAVAVL